MNLVARLMALVSFLVCVPAIAQVAEPQEIDQVLGLGSLLMTFFKSGQYLAAGAVITLIVVFAFRKYAMPKMKLKPGVLPLVSAAIGVISGAALALANGAPKEAAVLALLSGPAASSLWDVLIKYFFRRENG